MKKTFSTAQVRDIAGTVFNSWEENKSDIKLSGRALYSLIALKKQLEQKLVVIEETLAALAMQYGGEPQENGSILIPADQRAEANQAFIEMGNEQVEIEYGEIAVNDSSVLPLTLYEALFDFIKLED